VKSEVFCRFRLMEPVYWLESINLATLLINCYKRWNFRNILYLFKDEIIFWFIPSFLFFTFYLLTNKSLYVPKIILFILILFCFIITEFKVIRGVEYQSEYTYSIGLIKFYSIFSIFFLIKKNHSLMNFIIKYSEIFISLIIIYFYYDYFSNGIHRLS